MRRPLTFVAVVGAVVSALVGVPGATAAITSPSTTVPAVVPPVDIASIIDVGDAKPPRSYDSYLAGALHDLQVWWGTEFPRLFGEPYSELEGGIYAAYPERTSPIPACGSGSQTTYQEVSDFGAFYCGIGDFMAYDDGEQGVLFDLARQHGPSIIAVVLAHEFGHAIQERLGAFDEPIETVISEQQADCFSGAWSRRAWDGQASGLPFDDNDVRTGLVALVSVRDPAGTSVFDDGGHGSAFDRIGAFQHGFIGGIDACANLLEQPLPLLPNKFRDGGSDAANLGNSPFGYADNQIMGIVQSDLIQFWPAELGALGMTAPPLIQMRPVDPSAENCDGDPELVDTGAAFCAASGEVMFNELRARDLYDRFGDFAVGYGIGHAWADGIQVASGLTLAGERRALISDCLVGAWTASAIAAPDDFLGTTTTSPVHTARGLQVSPGDLDEAIQTALLIGDGSLSDNRRGSAFEKIAYLRIGVLDGTARCFGEAQVLATAAEGPTGLGATAKSVNFAALDIGTNSVHLVVARPTTGAGFETITSEKESVRLGSGGGDMKLMTPEAINRGVAALARMRAVADGHDAVLRAVATSATREALNAREFVARAAAEAGVDIEVISGIEEARLIHLGVLQAVPVFDRPLLLVDVGGGSTELLLGASGETLAARSFKLGAVRLTDRYFPAGAVTAKALRSCRDYVRATIEHFRRDVERFGFEVAIASSGTAETAARMVHAARAPGAAWEPLRTYNCFEFGADELAAIAAELAHHRTPEARVRTRGLDAPRADIIVAGVLILSTIAETFDVQRFTFSEAALREGVLVDTMSRFDESRRPGVGVHHLRDVSRRSIQQLVDRCDEDPQHSRHVAELAVSLFDQLPDLRRLDELLDVAPTRLSAREYLEAAALLANVGLVVAHSRHHLHAYYIIRNSELTGLTDGEIEIIAQVARYHRKSEPRASHPGFAALDPVAQDVVRSLAAVLRVAIGLDRRHDGRVMAVQVTDGDAVTVRAMASGDSDVELELYAARERTELLARALGRPVDVVAG